MQNGKSGSVFDLLAKPVRKALVEAGFTEPTLPQTLAFPLILEGKNVLLISPTGTGKTEAVLLPIFSKLVEQKLEENKGIQAIYITPLRALNRDMQKRLTFWGRGILLKTSSTWICCGRKFNICALASFGMTKQSRDKML